MSQMVRFLLLIFFALLQRGYWPHRSFSVSRGEDGIPYPVDKETYDRSIELLRKAINRTKLGLKEKNEAMGRLERG